MQLVWNQHIRPCVSKEMDGQWMFSWPFDSAAFSQAALSNKEDAAPTRRTEREDG